MIAHHFLASERKKIIIFWLAILYHTPIAIHVRTRRKMSF